MKESPNKVVFAKQYKNIDERIQGFVQDRKNTASPNFISTFKSKKLSKQENTAKSSFKKSLTDWRPLYSHKVIPAKECQTGTNFITHRNINPKS